MSTTTIAPAAPTHKPLTPIPLASSLDMARWLLDHQYSPVATKGKKPLRKDWPDITYTPETLEADFAGPDVHVGLLLGKGLVDVDMELSEVVDLAAYLLPNTPFAWGRPGKPKSHRVYSCDAQEKTKRFASPGGVLLVELRCAASQSAIPPTLHPSGERYGWTYGGPGVPEEAGYLDLHTRVALLAVGAAFLEALEHGSRHDAYLALAGVLASHQFERQDASALFTGLVKVSGDSDSQDRADCLTSAYALVEKGEKPAGYAKLGEVLGEEFAKWAKKTLRTVAPNKAGASEKPTIQEAIEVLLEKYGDDLAYDAKGKHWHGWTGTHWEELDESSVDLGGVALDVLTTAGFSVTTKQQSLNLFFYAAPHFAREIRTNLVGKVNFKNGTLDVGDWSLAPHSLADGLTYCLPYEYTPEAAWDGIKAFLKESVPDDWGVQTLLAQTGLALMGDRKIHKAVILYGPPRSGKGTFAKLANLVCGQVIGGFAGAPLFDAGTEGARSRMTWHTSRLVGVDELPSEAVRGGEIFKSITAHEGVPMRAMHKLEGKENEWGPKLMLMTNNLPRFSDADGSISSRLVVIDFPKRHGSNPEGSHPPSTSTSSTS